VVIRLFVFHVVGYLYGAGVYLSGFAGFEFCFAAAEQPILRREAVGYILCAATCTHNARKLDRQKWGSKQNQRDLGGWAMRPIIQNDRPFRERF